ncbi:MULTISPECIES: glycosyltransferase [Blautia]|uniref:glycosyltransferase n=1 Tax=Blautia TaxID=572511 RepID=UPI000BA4548E|nr:MULTISPECIES: glycosyltransferase [Blautia]
MRVLLLGGVFDDSHNDEIVSKTRTYVEYAANNFQKKIIGGLQECGIDLEVISAPFIGAYPNAYADWYFDGFDPRVIDNSGYKYVNFINVWGIRNLSRSRAARRALKDFIDSNDSDKLIIVYTSHTPLIQAANYAKKKDSRIKICLVVPDLPQYMNLADNVSTVYKIMKKFDVKAFQKENALVDSYVILTEPMAEDLKIGKRPYCVVEGIYQEVCRTNLERENTDIRTIVYTGKLDRSFGIMNLVDAFMKIDDENLRLLICGSGEEKENVIRCIEQDKRILYKGQVTSDVARQYILEGDVLVNPRQNNSDYTKYSFPSKIIDYLATGNPVVAYKLDGMPKQYRDFIYFVPDDTVEALKKTIMEVLYGDEEIRIIKSQKALQYLQSGISQKEVAKKILFMNVEKDFTGV